MIDPFISIHTLRENLDSVVVADCRWYLDGRSGRAAYDAGHVPGAVFVDLDTALTRPADPAAAGRHPLAEPAEFAAAMGALGIGDDDTLVAYDDAGGVIAARLVWMLRATGHEAALLDGGLDAWDGDLATAPAVRPAAAFTAREWPDELLATIEEVADVSRRTVAGDPDRSASGDDLTGSATVAEPAAPAPGLTGSAAPAEPAVSAPDPAGSTPSAEPAPDPAGPTPSGDPAGSTPVAYVPILIDARQRERFLGEPDDLDPRAGHIPGARCVPCRENLDDAGKVLPPAELRARFGIDDATEVISYCGSGVTACHNLLAMEQAGLGRGRLFPGSWSQWSRDPARAAETTPAGTP